jgi:hypothetical protein
MKKIIKFKKVFLLVLGLSLFSCDNYLDVNNNPNDVPYSSLAPKDLISAAQSNTFRTQSLTMNQLGNVFMNFWAGNVTAFTGGYSREFQLTIDSAFYNGIWDGLYRNVANFHNIETYPNPDGKYDYYVAVSKICKAHYMQYIVDLYGDCPYTEAFLGQANTTPKYDDDFEVYKKLIASLEDARNLIDNADATVVEDITAYDVMLGGDMDKWKQFANTLELRMLLRMSNATGTVATYRDSKLPTLATSTFLSSDVAINPGYTSNSNDQMNPFNINFSYDTGGTATTNWTFVCMSGHAYKFLRNNAPSNGTEIVPSSGVFYPGVNDPRALRKFRGTLRGVTQGSNVVDVPGSGTPARIGYGLLNPYLTKPEPIATVAQVLSLGENDGYVMTASEAFFLQAEAAVRYPSIFGSINAQSAFNSGISASFAHDGVPTSLSTYMTAIASKPGLGWTASGTDPLKYRAIMTQKWIALMGVHGIESFIDYNRTNEPVTPLATTATKTRKPYRLIYPVSEYVANSANVPNVSEAEIFSINSKSPFWLQ